MLQNEAWRTVAPALKWNFWNVWETIVIPRPSSNCVRSWIWGKNCMINIANVDKSCWPINYPVNCNASRFVLRIGDDFFFFNHFRYFVLCSKRVVLNNNCWQQHNYLSALLLPHYSRVAAAACNRITRSRPSTSAVRMLLLAPVYDKTQTASACPRVPSRRGKHLRVFGPRQATPVHRDIFAHGPFARSADIGELMATRPRTMRHPESTVFVGRVSPCQHHLQMRNNLQ